MSLDAGAAGARSGARHSSYAQALAAVRVMLPFVRPHWRSFIPIGVGVVAASALALVRPWPLKYLVDDVLGVGRPGGGSGSRWLIVGIALAIVGIAALHGLINFSKDYFMHATSQRVAFSMRRALFEHLQRLSLSFHDRQRTGELITRLTDDVRQVQEYVAEDLLVSGTSAAFQLVGMLTLMLALNWKLGLVALCLIPLLTFALIHFRGRIKNEALLARKKEGDVASLATETMISIRIVKAFGREAFESSRFEEHTSEAMEAGIRVSRLGAAFSWAVGVAAAISMAAVVGVGANQVLAGALSAGTLIVFISYLRDFQGPVGALAKLSTKTAKASVRVARIREVLDERPVVADLPDAAPAPRFAGEIEFRRVSFGYAPEEAVLRNINLTVAPGELAAFVGPTGAGKSTLASLILRLYDPVDGQVLVDGHDVRAFKLDSLVEQISIVFQQSVLIGATIRENIAYGRPGASLEEIRAAAHTACCDDFIEALPDAYDTVVGERGDTLSGGQRQRIAIARAVIRDAPILILDEPTTGLDAKAERLVMQAIEKVRRRRTTILISHNLSAARHADRIYVLSRGRIAEQGSHRDLVAKGRLYARTYALQSRPLRNGHATEGHGRRKAAARRPAGNDTRAPARQRGKVR